MTAPPARAIQLKIGRITIAAASPLEAHRLADALPQAIHDEFVRCDGSNLPSAPPVAQPTRANGTLADRDSTHSGRPRNPAERAARVIVAGLMAKLERRS